MFGTLQKRLPQELRLAGITTRQDANRFLKEVFWPAHNVRFARPAEAAGSAFVAFAGNLDRRHPLAPGGACGRGRQHGAL